MVCVECNKVFGNDIGLHRHLRAHKLSVAGYWQKHYPRYDLYDKSLIRFKSKEYYLSSSFNSRENFAKWMIEATEDQRKEYIINFFSQRKLQKNLIYSLTQADLKTLMCPGMKYINDLFGDYYKLCSQLGFRNRFQSYALDKDKFTDISKKVIFTDTREQKPLDFNVPNRIMGMNFGDYRMNGSNIYIERKSVNDFWGTFTIGYERFRKEIERAELAKAYLIILVEGTLNEVHLFPHRRQVRGKIRMSSEIPLHNMRDLLRDYAHIQFVFVNGRTEASRIIEVIFSAGDQCETVDLQYLVDTKGI